MSNFRTLAPQEALAAAVTSLVQDRRTASQIISTVALHLHTTATRQILSAPWEGYASGLAEVAERMSRETFTDETPVTAGVIIEG